MKSIVVPLDGCNKANKELHQTFTTTTYDLHSGIVQSGTDGTYFPSELMKPYPPNAAF